MGHILLQLHAGGSMHTRNVDTSIIDGTCSKHAYIISSEMQGRDA